MSLRRRRWSSDLLDSLIDFQSRENSHLEESLVCDKKEGSNDSLNDNHMNIKSMLDNLSSYNSEMTNSNKCSEENSACCILMNSYDNSERSKSVNIADVNMIKDDNVSKIYSHNSHSNKDYMNLNVIEIQNGSISKSKMNRTAEFDSIPNLNEKLCENVTISSGSETIKPSSTNSSVQNINEKQLVSSHSYNLNERITENISEDSGTIKQSSCNSSFENLVEIEELKNHLSYHLNKVSKEDLKNKRFSLSSFESAKLEEEIIAEMNEPDVWDALLTLDQALSPFDEPNQHSDQCIHSTPHILNRLSQKFKKTPTRFTEKLVSIIEDSIVSSESPAKHYTGDTSGISLNRMTGEFRKLCKFIEDESMPEWAPSLANVTASYFEKTETPEQKQNTENIDSDTPKSMSKIIDNMSSVNFTPINKELKTFTTPKNKVDTPIKQFTPSADKSFEYWELVCNMMCDNQSTNKKNLRRSISVPESMKMNMDKILTICEHQMASLDDSTIGVRNSEPCKKIDNELKLKITQTPRSKSVSKIYSNINDKQSSKPHIDKIENEHLIFDNKIEALEISDDVNTNESEISDDNLKMLSKNNTLNIIEEKTLQEDSEVIYYSPTQFSMESLHSDNEQNCSLLLELAKRRQRCLDTAKLMLEIDSEDPTIKNEDNKCLETLYKLGVQDKTFTETDEDTKFLNTLGHCLEYKKYFKSKSKPIVNMLQKLNSPNNLEGKTLSLMKSKKSINQPRSSNLNVKNHQISALNKACLEQNLLKNVPDKKTPKLIPKTLSRPAQKIERKTSDLKQMKTISKVDKKPQYLSGSQQIKAPSKPLFKSTPKLKSQIDKNRLEPQFQQKKVTPKVVNKPLQDQKPGLSKKIARNISPQMSPQICSKSTLQSEEKKITPKVTLKSVSKILITPERATKIIDEKSPVLHEKYTPKAKLFLTPGKSSNSNLLTRKKPQQYFSDVISKRITPQKTNYDNVKSPIGLYIKGIDAELVQNVESRTNDCLLTPVSNSLGGNSPKLKFKLSSKENKSPVVSCNKNIILPQVNYQSAKKVHLIDDKSSYSPISLNPNSKTKKLLGPIENTVLIRHEGRILDDTSKSDILNSETSIRIQKVAEKVTTIRKKHM